MKYYTTLILSALLLISCEKGVDEKIPLDVTNIELIDMGQVPFKYTFKATPLGEKKYRCFIRTVHIKKNDTIEYVEASLTGNNMMIHIVSSPYDFDCNDDSCFTLHDLYFDISPLSPKKYNMEVYVNNGMNKDQPLTYEFK